MDGQPKNASRSRVTAGRARSLETRPRHGPIIVLRLAACVRVHHNDDHDGPAQAQAGAPGSARFGASHVAVSITDDHDAASQRFVTSLALSLSRSLSRGPGPARPDVPQSNSGAGTTRMRRIDGAAPRATPGSLPVSLGLTRPVARCAAGRRRLCCRRRRPHSRGGLWHSGCDTFDFRATSHGRRHPSHSLAVDRARPVPTGRLSVPA